VVREKVWNNNSPRFSERSCSVAKSRILSEFAHEGTGLREHTRSSERKAEHTILGGAEREKRWVLNLVHLCGMKKWDK
jgi:hypothetical protein